MFVKENPNRKKKKKKKKILTFNFREVTIYLFQNIVTRGIKNININYCRHQLESETVPDWDSMDRVITKTLGRVLGFVLILS